MPPPASYRCPTTNSTVPLSSAAHFAAATARVLKVGIPTGTYGEAEASTSLRCRRREAAAADPLQQRIRGLCLARDRTRWDVPSGESSSTKIASPRCSGIAS